jgi:hypothetical protein
MLDTWGRPDLLDDSAFKGRLLQGERIVWSGGPQQGLLFRRSDIVVAPFVLFAVWWSVPLTVNLWSGTFDALKSWPIWPVPLVIVVMILARFVGDALIRSGVRYAITDRRVLIIMDGILNNFVAIPITQLSYAKLVESRNGVGDIQFDLPEPPPRGVRGGPSISWVPAASMVPQFVRIGDARKVFDLIQDLRHGD